MADKTIDWDDDFLGNDPNPDTGLVRESGTYINTTREAVTERLTDEHLWDPAEPAPQSNMGMHKKGSGVAYVQSSPPSLRPDGITGLNEEDAGRLWFDTAQGQMNGWNGIQWINLSTSGTGTILRWQSSAQYAQHEIVEYNGTLWRASVSDPVVGDIPSEATGWILFSLSLPDNIKWRGGHTYQPQMVVYYSSAFWQAVSPVINSSPGSTPGEWDIIEFASASIADGSITNAKMAPDSITTAEIVNETILTEDLSDNSVTESKIVDGSVTFAKTAPDAYKVSLWRADQQYAISDIVNVDGYWWEAIVPAPLFGLKPVAGSSEWKPWTDQTTATISGQANVVQGRPNEFVFCDTSVNPLYDVTLEDGLNDGDRVTLCVYGDGQITVIGTGLSDQYQSNTSIQYIWSGVAWLVLGGSGGGGGGLAVGEIIWFPSQTADLPDGTLACNGAIQNIVDYPELFIILGTQYGGDGLTTFGIPTMRGIVYEDPNTTEVEVDPDGTYLIQAALPIPSVVTAVLVDVTIGSVRWWASDITDQYDLECNGQSVLVGQYPELFGIINYTYGGSGSSFNLPDLRGITPGHVGTQDVNGRTKGDSTIIGDIREDQMQDFVATSENFDRQGAPDGWEDYNGSAGYWRNANWGSAGSVSITISEGTAGTPRLGEYTRSNELVGKWVIRASNPATYNVPDANELKDAILDLVFPVGMTFMQLAGAPDPATMLWPGTWTNISPDFAGDFFRVEGGAASAFESGQQLDAMQRMTGDWSAPGNWDAGYVGQDLANGILQVGTGFPARARAQSEGSYTNQGFRLDTAGESGTQFKTDGDGVGSGETRAVNQTIRIWKRTA